jgi:hypothetical protein
MEEATSQILNRKQIESLVQYNTELYKKYLKMNKKLFDNLDFEAKKPGFQKLLKDNRVIAEIKGDKPVTVKDLAEALQKKFFHGIDDAIQNKKVNKSKDDSLQQILTRKVLRLEALKKGIDKTEIYKKAVSDHEKSVLFGVFLQKAIAPTIKMDEQELTKYYEDHKTDFMYPQMMKLQSLAFSQLGDARAALDKLKKGDEFGWVKANSEGQITKSTEPLLQLSGDALITKELDEGIQKVVNGVRTGDSRLFESPGGVSYVIYVQEVIPENPRPFADVRDEILKRVFGKKVADAIEDWGRKLRESSEVTIYATDSGT